MADTQAARTQMVQQQIRAWHVLDLSVLAVFETLPRDKFVPETYRNVAYADAPIPLPHGEWMWIPPSKAACCKRSTPVHR